MIKFEYQFDMESPRIVVEMRPDSTLSEILEQFSGFLKAAGYFPSGELDFIDAPPVVISENEEN